MPLVTVFNSDATAFWSRMLNVANSFLSSLNCFSASSKEIAPLLTTPAKACKSLFKSLSVRVLLRCVASASASDLINSLLATSILVLAAFSASSSLRYLAASSLLSAVVVCNPFRASCLAMIAVFNSSICRVNASLSPPL